MRHEGMGLADRGGAGSERAEPYGIPRLAPGEGNEILLPGFIPGRPWIFAWFLGRLERGKREELEIVTLKWGNKL